MRVADQANNNAWPAELEAFYAARWTSFVRLAYLMTGRSDVAEEVVQDAFVSCAPRWADIDRPSAYVRRAVANGCRDWLRRLKLDRERTAGAPDADLMGPDELWDALGRLDERRRLAVVLRFYEDLPDNEIAEVLGCAPSTVRSLVHRALADLRREVKR